MGFAITSDGAAVIPVQPGAYIVADDEWDNLDLAGYQDSGAWQVTGYNNDGFDHTVYLIFKTVPPGGDQAAPASVQPAPALIDNAALSSSAPDVAGFLAGIQVQS
jgi:hypothetical protein